MEHTITLIAAIVFSFIGVGTFVHYFLMVRSWPVVSGRVTGNETANRSDHDSYSFFPRVEFYAADGKRYEVRGDIGRNDEWPVGQILKVRYRMKNPNHASIAHDWQRLLFSLVFLGFAAACWYVLLR